MLEYLGRRDQQVKIRGYRIELGEIEAMIADCDGVKEAAVVVRQSVGHDKHLVGYVVPKAQLSDCLNTEKLKEDLRKQLPEYMIPPLFVELQHMPRTGSGKLDRGRLPNPDENRTQRCPMPRAGVEELLAQIWTDVLKVDQIDCEDNFFKLGGHSLLAAQLVARVREVFRVDVPLRMIFDHPSLESMSRQIQIEQGQEPMLYEGIRPRATSERRRLSYEQHALWLTDRLSAGSAPYNLPTAVKLEGDLNVEALRIAMNEVVRRHEILRTHFELGEEGEPEQVIVSEMHLECPLIEVLGKNEEQKWEQVRLWAAQEAEMGFDLKSGPLMRAKLLRVSEQMHVALLTLHHIISDGWSQAIMVEEISKIYRAQSEQKHHLLEDLPIQYGDYAAWQKDWLRPEILDRQLDYWRRQLEGIDALLNLPTDYTRPSVRSYRGGHHRVELPDKLGFRLQELARRQSATLFMLLLAAFKVLLWRLSGSTDIPVSTSIANRTTRATERLIGLFLNTLVLRTRLDPAETFLNLLEKVRQNALGAYAHRDLPFENLVHNLERGKKPEYSPLFQVMFILQNFPINKLELPRLSISQLDVLPPVSKCDLTLFVSEEQGRIGALFEYSTDLFDPWTIENMSRTFILLLLEICNDPNRALGVLTSDGHETREMIDSFLDSID
ncbi:MAG TPA: condensation domain-containing protein [Edaphobacter sp.]|nr:condensation domain-containing protein [Edaphobacter sp.]